MLYVEGINGLNFTRLANVKLNEFSCASCSLRNIRELLHLKKSAKSLNLSKNVQKTLPKEVLFHFSA